MRGEAVLRVVCCVLLLLGAACRKAPPAQSKAPVLEVNLDRDNLLNIARGASVVSRTGELELENSAVHAIDGDVNTSWRSPPGGASQTMVFSLPARARVTRVGVLSIDKPHELASQVRFEASDDGTAWRDVTTMALVPRDEPQHVDVAPFDAAYLRVSTIESRDYYSFLASVFAFGREIAPPRPPRIEGCWTINGLPARFVQRGTAVSGVIASNPPLLLSGASDGRTVRFMWRHGPSWGPALINVDPSGRTLSGARWFELVSWHASTHGWFGERGPCPAIPVEEAGIAVAILRRARYWMMYGGDSLDTAAALIAQARPHLRFRVTAPDRKRLDAARAALQSRGVDMRRVDFAVASPPAKIESETQRVMADGLALHLQ